MLCLVWFGYGGIGARRTTGTLSEQMDIPVGRYLCRPHLNVHPDSVSLLSSSLHHGWLDLSLWRMREDLWSKCGRWVLDKDISLTKINLFAGIEIHNRAHGPLEIGQSFVSLLSRNRWFKVAARPVLWRHWPLHPSDPFIKILQSPGVYHTQQG